MAYTINRWDSTAIAVIEDGTVNQSLDVKLIGKNYAGYGEIQNENTVHMLENFAGAIYPASAIRGQLWYDTANKKLKLHNGEIVGTAKQWKTIGGAEYGITEPSYANNGDLWFDTTRDQLKVRNGDAWLAVGPQSAGAGTTQMISKQVLGKDTPSSTATARSIIIAVINNEPVYIISKEQFYLEYTDTDSNIVGFNNDVVNLVKQGLTLPYTNNDTGIAPIENHRFWGTAANALSLGGVAASNFVQSGNSNFTATVRFSDLGYTVGDSNDLAVFIQSGTEPIIQNSTGPRISFRVRDGSDERTPLVLNTTIVEPGVTDTFKLGRAERKWTEVHATSFIGIATQANELNVGGTFRVASTSAGANTVASRDASGDLYATTFRGNATSANRLSTIRTINGVNFDGTANIIVEDSTRVAKSGDTMSGFLTLHAQPTNALHAATKNYVDSKFGVGGVLPISSGGTNATTAENARSNLSVPSISGVGATGTWSISISGTAGNASAVNTFPESASATPNTIARRDSSGNLTANVFNGVATAARYADLAEKYLTDNEYEVGTVVMVGGEKEMTASAFGCRAIGAISANPAYMMNSGLEGGQYVALKGRVPVKVTGRVKKGDRMIAADGGVAVAGTLHTNADTFAVALESSDNTDIKLVECLIL
jgi:hypothetical protein